MVTRVKICGLTTARDLDTAIEFGADAVGVILEPTSPRCVAGDGELLAHVRRVHPFATTVAVFGRTVNWDLCTGFAAVQAHGLLSAPAFKLLRAHALADDDNLSFLADGDPDAWLLDAAVPGAFGGTGKRVDWDLAAEVVRRSPRPVILAGGLNPDNVAEAIARVRPSAVDVSSGVESSPRGKDWGKVRAFIEAARSA